MVNSLALVLFVIGALAGTPFALGQAYFQPLDFLDGYENGTATAISADGSTVVGAVNTGNTQAFRWRADTGMIGLGDLPGGIVYSWAAGVSADGSVVVGYDYQSTLAVEGFRWTVETGMVGLAAR